MRMTKKKKYAFRMVLGYMFICLTYSVMVISVLQFLWNSGVANWFGYIAEYQAASPLGLSFVFFAAILVATWLLKFGLQFEALPAWRVLRSA